MSIPSVRPEWVLDDDGQRHWRGSGEYDAVLGEREGPPELTPLERQLTDLRETVEELRSLNEELLLRATREPDISASELFAGMTPKTRGATDDA